MEKDLLLFNSNSNSTKGNIIEILSNNWPLSVKKIYFILKRKYSLKFTYQAVYKAIQEMVNEKILLKDKLGYKLNISWVKDIHNKTEIIRVNYFSEQKSLIFDKSNEDKHSIDVLIFKNWFDVEKYLYYFQKDFLLKSKEKHSFIFHHSHEWRPLFYLRAEYNWVRELIKKGNRYYTLCSGESVVDRWAVKFYEKIGERIKLNQKCAETAELISFSDYIIQVYIPLDIKQKLDEYLNNLKDLNGVDFSHLIKEIFEKDSEIKVIINRDRKLAEEIQKQTISKFKTNKS